MTTTPTAAPRGDRATWKVRRVARARHAELGELRFVAARRGTRLLRLVLGGMFLVFAVLTLVGTGSLGDRLGVLPFYLLMLGAVYGVFVQDKLLVFERGIVLGWFGPGPRTMALPFHALDAASVRGSLGWGGRRGSGTMLRSQPLAIRHENHTHVAAPFAVTFLGPDPRVVRGATAGRRARRTTPLVPGEAPPHTVWSFGTPTGPDLDTVVRELASALEIAGYGRADEIVARALPPRRLTATAEDADYLGLPAEARAPGLRAVAS